MTEWIHCDDCEKNGTDDCPHLMNNELRLSSCKEGVQKSKVPSVIVQKTFVDEKNDRIFVREYDANAPNDPPRKKQLLFPDPHDEGCIAVDWSQGAETILHLYGIEYNVMDFSKNGKMKKKVKK